MTTDMILNNRAPPDETIRPLYRGVLKGVRDLERIVRNDGGRRAVVTQLAEVTDRIRRMLSREVDQFAGSPPHDAQDLLRGHIACTCRYLSLVLHYQESETEISPLTVRIIRGWMLAHARIHRYLASSRPEKG